MALTLDQLREEFLARPRHEQMALFVVLYESLDETISAQRPEWAFTVEGYKRDLTAAGFGNLLS